MCIRDRCITKGYGRENQRSIRKMTSNIDKEVLNPDETVIVCVWDEHTMDEGIYSLDMKGLLKKLAEGPYLSLIHIFVLPLPDSESNIK